MENQCHHSSAQNQAASEMQRLSPNIHHSHSLAPARKNSCPQLHLSNLDTPCYASPFPRSVCLPATGSTTSAIVHLTHRLSDLLQEHPFVHVIALDFSKAFDTVRHNALLNKLAQFPLPDFAYNWVADFRLDRKHLTKFEQVLSSVLAINASIIQSSIIGPTAYVIDASDLKILELANSLDKYADVTYLIVPASHSHTISDELDNVSAWAVANNLSLNVNKSCEMIVRRPHLAINDLIIPPALPGVKRVFELNILGVRMSDRMDFTPHINYVTTAAVQSTYALRVLRAHGLSGPNLWDVTRAKAVAKLTYACHAW